MALGESVRHCEGQRSSCPSPELCFGVVCKMLKHKIGGLQHELWIWCKLDCQTLARTSIPKERERPQRCCAEQGPASARGMGPSRPSPNRPNLTPVSVPWRCLLKISV